MAGSGVQTKIYFVQESLDADWQLLSFYGIPNKVLSLEIRNTDNPLQVRRLSVPGKTELYGTDSPYKLFRVSENHVYDVSDIQVKGSAATEPLRGEFHI